MISKSTSFVVLLFCLALISSCTMSRTSTTARTAVEMALLSETADRSLSQLETPTMVYYNRFFMDASEFEAPDEEYALSALRLHLLKMGMHSVDKTEDADVIVYPRAAVAAIDDSQFLLGIPEIPVAIPGAGSVSLPELALFKRHKQIGRNRIGAYAIDSEDRNLAFDMGTGASTANYTRWTILIFLNFSTTDLGEPYRKPKKAKEATAE